MAVGSYTEQNYGRRSSVLVILFLFETSLRPAVGAGAPDFFPRIFVPGMGVQDAGSCMYLSPNLEGWQLSLEAWEMLEGWGIYARFSSNPASLEHS